MKLKLIKIKCVSKYPFVEVPKIGRAKPGDVKEVREDVGNSLVLSEDWDLVRQPKPVTPARDGGGK